ncbi:MarR family transcriptional regulator [Bradyrhizobium tropiciagri]|uniref:MarR family winged helix-turn-helix transcriptional regulator n=1 Tax=Bradyrhizobium tropiciagri TaxID=312253 RepID=UPI001BADA450|nr:MarR family transcriptional regulator [Bradyrhizobium tropiciagri]MBR0872055.1 MarR family transcriptional regulator [Bradyrhizobium tropiciagri]
MYRFSNSLPYLLARLGVRMGDLFVRVIRHEKLTLPMYRVLAALSEQGHALRLGEIAELTSADVSTLSRIVADMSRAGLLTRDRPENDQRSLQVALTPEGAALANRLMPIAQYYEEVATGAMSAKEAAELKQVLVELYKNLDRLEHEVEAGLIEVPPAATSKETRETKPDAKGSAGRRRKVPRK